MGTGSNAGNQQQPVQAGCFTYRMKHWIRFFVAFMWCSAGVVLADVSEVTVRLAATGQFDQLQALLEQEHSKRVLTTRDQHALCYAYSKTKNYSNDD